MQAKWLCLNGTYKNRKDCEILPLGINFEFGESDNNLIPQVVESSNIKEAYIYIQKEDLPNIIKTIFCEGCKPKITDIPMIEILARKGYAYFWDINDLLWFLKFANRLIFSPHDIVELMYVVERGNHSSRVTQLCSFVGSALGMDNFLWEDVLYHDLGKIAIPQSLLFAPRYFTEVEKEIAKTHVLIGSYYIDKLNLDGAKKSFALYHHERYNGGGYYKGLKDNHIPKPVRVLTICDVYEALSSHRPYRSAVDEEMILSFLQSKSGSWFDPEIVTVFLDLIMSKKYSQKEGRIIYEI